jgi:hypothetical protein
MSQVNIRKAFEKKLITFTPANTISFENASFTPVANVPYYVCRLAPQDVLNPTLGDNYHREVGIFQVVLCFPAGNGGQATAAKAEELKQFFRRSTTLVEGDTTVIVNKTPSIGSAYTEGNRYCVPVRVSYFTNEF